MDVVVLCGEERLMTLEVMKTEVEIWKPDLEKKVNDITLEFTRVTKFFEQEHQSASFDKSGIFGPYESTTMRPPAQRSSHQRAVRPPCRQYHREHEPGLSFV